MTASTTSHPTNPGVHDVTTKKEKEQVELMLKELTEEEIASFPDEHMPFRHLRAEKVSRNETRTVCAMIHCCHGRQCHLILTVYLTLYLTLYVLYSCIAGRWDQGDCQTESRLEMETRIPSRCDSAKLFRK
jgi:hypothetical protein